MYLIFEILDFRCTGNSKFNQVFDGDVASMEPRLDESTGELSAASPSFTDESSCMVTGVIPLIIEVNGKPLWINKDMNSPFAFRPSRMKFEVCIVY